MKKIAATLIVLLITAIAVFYIGYLPLRIPAGDYGVITTKTGGTAYPVIKPGDFCWRWERLFPTNLHLSAFSLVPVNAAKTISGELPSASAFAGNSAVYKYTVNINLAAAIIPEFLPEAVAQHYFTTQQEYETWVQTQLDSAAGAAVQKLFSTALSQNDSTMTDTVFIDQCTDALRSELTNRHIEPANITVTVSDFPDFSLYAAIKQEYLLKNSAQAADTAANTPLAKDSGAPFLALEQWGVLLTKYPVLAELLKAQNGDPALFKELIAMGSE